MNEMSKETLLVIIATLSEKVAIQELVCDGYAHALKESEEQATTISHLRRNLEEAYDSKDYLTNQNNTLCAQVRQLQTELHKLTYGGQTPEETATAYMKAQGVDKWEGGNRIGCIKVCREVSGWGLYESKQFCEAYMVRHQAHKESEEDTPSGTKRSSQIPVGVGLQSKRSA